MVYLDTLPGQVSEWKSSIEDIVTQFDDMEKYAKNVMEATSQFWGSVVHDEQWEKLTTKLQEADNQLAMLKTTLRTIPPLVSITRSTKLKELQQRVGKAQEQQWKRNDHLNEFQEIGSQLLVKAVATLQAMQDGKKEVNAKMVEHQLK